MFASSNSMPRKSKKSMLEAIPDKVVASKLVARNTLDYTNDFGVRRIRLHSTDILTFKKNEFVIDTGGWNTHTTRNRLNQHLPSPWRVYTKKARAYLTNGEIDVEFNKTVKVVNGKPRADVTMAANNKLFMAIDKYMKAWKEKGLPTVEESGGDPWVFTEGKIDKHIMLDWVKSKYVFRKLYYMALKYAGLTDQGAYYFMRSADTNGLDSMAYRRIRRYVRVCLGFTDYGRLVRLRIMTRMRLSSWFKH